MKILIFGCLHSFWEEAVKISHEQLAIGNDYDLIIILGDLQTFRNNDDLLSFTAPEHYRGLGTFNKIYSGEIAFPRPTILVGGNHEATDFLFQLPFGGWVAPNVYYLGRAGSLSIGTIKICGVSGIVTSQGPTSTFYYQPVNETFPVRDPMQIASAIQTRAFSDFQILGLKSSSVFISHDWPATIPRQYGGHYLKQRKQYLIDLDRNNTFGLPKGMEFINHLKPEYYFAAHHHINFNANINTTKFVALPKLNPKCPNRWHTIVEIPGEMDEIKYDGEWIAILKATAAEMTNPSILEHSNWTSRWETLRQTMEHFDDQPLGSFDPDPARHTIAFCKQFGIYCPNPELRHAMQAPNIEQTNCA